MSENTKTKQTRTKKVDAIVYSKISATSSVTINLGNYNSARLEMTIEKIINNPKGINIEEEKVKLWDEVNMEVDKQAQDVKNSLK